MNSSDFAFFSFKLFYETHNSRDQQEPPRFPKVIKKFKRTNYLVARAPLIKVLIWTNNNTK